MNYLKNKIVLLVFLSIGINQSFAQKQDVLVFGFSAVKCKIGVFQKRLFKSAHFEFVRSELKGKKLDEVINDMHTRVKALSEPGALHHLSYVEADNFPGLLVLKIPIGQLLPGLNKPEAVIYKWYEFPDDKNIQEEISEGIKVIHKWLDSDFGQAGEYEDLYTLLQENEAIKRINYEIPYEYQAIFAKNKKIPAPVKGTYRLQTPNLP